MSTPDGENCGLVKNLAVMGLVTTAILKPLEKDFEDCGMKRVANDTSTSLHGKVKIFLNGDWIGVCEDSLSFVTKLRRKRRRKEIPPEVPSNFCCSIIYDQRLCSWSLFRWSLLID